MINDNIPLDDIYSLLTEEERAVLEKIEKKAAEALQQMKENKFDYLEELNSDVPDFASKHPDVIHPKNLTKSPHEIVITVRGEVSEIDDKGNVSNVKNIVEKFYHIPVKAQDDYEIYLNQFFDKFHTSIESTCQELNSCKKES